MPGSAILGTSENQALNHPSTSTEKHQLKGVPMGMFLNSHAQFYWSPWYLKQMGYIHSMYVNIFANKKAGKSAFIKMMAKRLSLTSPGGERFRVEINDYKPEGSEEDEEQDGENTGTKGNSEYAPLAKDLRCMPFMMNSMQVNPLEPRLFTLGKGANKSFHEYGVLSMSKMLAEFDGVELSIYEYYALRILIYEITHNYREELWLIDTLEHISATIQESAVDGYHLHLRDKLNSAAESRALLITDETVREHELVKMRQLAATPRNIKFHELLPYFNSLAARFGNLRYGILSNMFGAKHSMYDLRTQNAVVKDWRGMDAVAMRLMRQIDSMITMSAAEMGARHLQPHMVVDDERHKPMDNLQYAEMTSYMSEIARAIPTFNVGASHDHDSIRKGDRGSRLWNLGDRVIKNSGLNIYGQVPNDPIAMEEKRSLLSLTDSDAYRLPRLRERQFAAKLFGEEGQMSYFETIATDYDLKYLIGTESAAEGLNKPHIVHSRDFQESYAKRHGLQLAN